jgi:hypothetical protein
VDLSPLLADHPSSVLIAGRSRLLVQLVAYGWAGRIDTDFGWVELEDPSNGGDAEDGKVFGLLPPERAFPVQRPEELIPDVGLTNLALWTVVRRDETSGEIARLTDFLLLPPPLQLLLGRVGMGPGPGALVVANAERLGENFPFAELDPRRIVATMKRENVTLILAMRARPFDVLAAAFDVVVHVEDTHAASTEQVRIRVERQPAGAGLPVGDNLTAGRLLPVASALRLARAEGWLPERA